MTDERGVFPEKSLRAPWSAGADGRAYGMRNAPFGLTPGRNGEVEGVARVPAAVTEALRTTWKER